MTTLQEDITIGQAKAFSEGYKVGVESALTLIGQANSMLINDEIIEDLESTYKSSVTL